MNDSLFARYWRSLIDAPELPRRPVEVEFDAIDQGDLVEFAERSVAVAWGDRIPGLIDESN